MAKKDLEKLRKRIFDNWIHSDIKKNNNMNHDLSETICPECGYKNPARNSSDEIQCENCGYDEANE